MDNKEMEKRELSPEELDQVSGGTGVPTEEDLQKMMEASKEFQQMIRETDEAKKRQLQRIKDMEEARHPSVFY